MRRLVDRFGRTGFAAIASLMWALPMAAWAGSADLSPIDKTAYPWIAFAIGLVMLVAWVVLLARLRGVQVSPRQRRFDLAQMSRSEKAWTLGVIAFGTGLLAWLNASATVEWSPLVRAVAAGMAGAIVLAIGIIGYVAVMLVGLAFSWRKASDAYAERARRTTDR